MQVQVKGSEMQEAYNYLNQIINKPAKQLGSAQFTFAYRLKRLTDNIRSAYNDLDSERRKLVKKYGKEDPVKHTISVTKENEDIFEKERAELYERDITIDIDLIITLELIKASGIDLSFAELAALDRFIEK